MFSTNRISKLENQVEDLMNERDNLRERLNDLKSKQYKEVIADVYESTFSFDFKGAKAFSIERIHDWDSTEEKYMPVTVIGYFKTNEGFIGEWRFYCSAEEHERLVKEFNEYKAKKK